MNNIKIQIQSSILHKGKHLEEGRVIELPEDEAKKLMGMGRARLFSEPKPGANRTPAGQIQSREPSPENRDPQKK